MHGKGREGKGMGGSRERQRLTTGARRRMPLSAMVTCGLWLACGREGGGRERFESCDACSGAEKASLAASPGYSFSSAPFLSFDGEQELGFLVAKTWLKGCVG